MSRLAELIEQHRETLATIETWNNGKPYSVSLNEDLTEAIETLRYYAGFADKVFGQVIETTPDKFAYTVREPVGVCGQIIPSVLLLLRHWHAIGMQRYSPFPPWLRLRKGTQKE